MRMGKRGYQSSESGFCRPRISDVLSYTVVVIPASTEAQDFGSIFPYSDSALYFASSNTIVSVLVSVRGTH